MVVSQLLYLILSEVVYSIEYLQKTLTEAQY